VIHRFLSHRRILGIGVILLLIVVLSGCTNIFGSSNDGGRS
jgi:hypothetical protein